MANKNLTVAITPTNPEDRFPALTLDPQELAENLAEIVGDGGLTFTDLTRVSVPNHKSAAFWSVEGLAEPVQFLEGIAIAWPDDRTMWEIPLSQNKEGTTQPDCHGTLDPDSHLMTGSRSQQWIYDHFNANQYVRKPEGLVPILPGLNGTTTRQLCDECPFGQFKTSSNGEGQFCNLKTHIYLLTEDSPIPIVVMAATKSLKAARQYFKVEMVKKMQSPLGVITRLGLVKQGQGTANPYYTITFEQAEVLPPELKARARAYAAAFRPFIEKMSKPASNRVVSAQVQTQVSDPTDFDSADDDIDQPL